MILKKVLTAMWLIIAAWSTVTAQSGSGCIQGAMVTTRSGATSVDICQGDGLPDIVRFKTSPAAMPFAYLITDVNNVVLGVSASNIINLEGYPVGALRVWAFAYLGSISAQVGQNAADGGLAQICYALSANFVTVNSINPEGGTVTTSTGAGSAFACVNNTGSNVISFATTNTGANYSYIVTNNSNLIVGVSTGNSFDFGTLPAGDYRVWGVAHAGPLNAPIGANITTAVLSNQCFGLSENFVTVQRGNADGGTIRTVAGANEIKFCRAQDAVAVALTVQSPAPASYVYVLTNTSNQIVSILPGNSFQPAGLPFGNYRIWGLSYSGNIVAQVGDNAATTTLSDACFDLSNNFIPVTLQDVNGGEIAAVNGSVQALCVGDGDADVVSFSAAGASGASYVWVVTDSDGEEVLAVSNSNSIDFEGYASGTVLVWGLAYSGTLDAQPGQSVDAVLQSLECFDLSQNAVALNLTRTNGGEVSLVGGATSINVCTGDGVSDELSFANNSDAAESYVYVVTDGNNNIIALSPSGVVDFEGAGVGVVRVWGLSYSGSILAQIGDNAASATLTDACYDLSDNFVTVDLRRTNGGNVSITGGAVFASVCANDSAADVLTFNNNSGFAPNYAYIVTDEDNIVQSISTTGMIDFEGTGSGIARVWGVAYTGSLLVAPGDDAAAVALSDECFDLSDNFVIVDRETVDGGMVMTPFGQTQLEFCGGDGFPDQAVYFSTAQAMGNFTFLITDANNTLLVETTSNFTDFESFGAGTFHIWGLSYTGNVTVQPGDNISSVALSDRCFALSGNFISVVVNTVDGGTVSLIGGGSSYLACGGDGTSDVALVQSTANEPGVNYTWLLTDEANEILAISSTADFNFDTYAPGTYRIWGLGYTGSLSATPGQFAGSVSLASECFSLSLNFVEVRVDIALGGEISAEDGSNFISICAGNDIVSEPITFNTTGSGTGAYVYVITDEENNIVRVYDNNVISFDDGLGDGRYRIWGLSYSGDLTAQIGDNAGNVALSDGCYQLSSNFIPLWSGFPESGTLAFVDGGDSRLICPDNGIADVISFNADGAAQNVPFVFLLTDANNVVLDIFADNSYDFDQTDEAELRVWALSYAGALLVQVGDNAAEVDLASECSELSNFLTVLRQKPEADSISLSDGSTFISACAGGLTGAVSFINTSDFAGNYIYVITDTDNVILDVATDNIYDFSDLTNDTVRVWGLAYTGNILAQIGDNAATITITDDCYDLSDNFITVVRVNPVGGTLTTADGQTQYLRCAGDGTPDPISFTVNGASNAPYLFLITDENNYLIGLATQPGFDFENAIEGVFRIHGISYTGVFQLFPGDSIFGAIPAASGCFDFSDNFIEINNIRVNGGNLFSDVPETVFYTCPADGVADVVHFNNTSNAPNANYAYLFTNENNVIIGLTFQDSFNFDIAGIGITRIWGVSYTGNFTANFGDNAATTPLSDQCYDLSNNFITVVRDVPSGGSVATTQGETSLTICLGIDPSVVTAQSTSASLVAYTFALTTEFNDILAFSDGGDFNFAQFGPGTYRIWGVSYTGSLDPMAENILSVDLGSSCLELSSNFITVVVTDIIAGGVLSANGDRTTVYFCPNDGQEDLVEMTTTSPTPADNYRYVVANQNGIVFIPDLMGNSIDFDGAGVGEYRIYGIAFTGNYQVGLGTNLNTADLSDGCFSLSTNFVRVLNAVADGGAVSTTEGATEVELDMQDGESDVLEFENTGSTDLPYLYVLTDDNNIVLGYLNGNSFDFEGQNAPKLRVWGLSYHGAPPTATDVPASELISAGECAEFSENFVSITAVVDPTLQGNANSLRATAQPNPASDRVTLRVWADEKTKSAPATVLIMDASGRVRDQYRLPEWSGFQQAELDISRLEEGVYTVQIRSAENVAVLRVVKSRL
jgi:hypothetical protein